MPAGMAASHLVVTKETRRRRRAPVRLHAPKAARGGVATDAEPSDSPCPAVAQRWARLGDLPASTRALWGQRAAGRACGSGGTSHGGTRPPNSRPMIACRTAARHRRDANRRPSCWLAPVSFRPSGVPHASVARWRFVPGMLQSVGFGRLAGPPLFGQDDGHRPDAPGPGRTHRPHASGADGASNRAAGRDADAVQPLPSRRPASSVMCPSPVTAGVERRGVTRSRRRRPSRTWRPGSTGSRLARDASGHGPALA